MLLTLIFLTSLLMVVFTIPPIINLALRKRLFDKPGEFRKVHKRLVPNFGGIAIFTAFLFTSSLFVQPALLPEGNALMAAGSILFMIGLNDDIVELGPLKKFFVQFASALIIAVVADIRITSLYGTIGIHELSYVASVIITMVSIVGVVNAFNLIDGIDGLAASLGVCVSLTYAYLFWNAGLPGWSYLSIALTGSLVGFLFFNVSPARIFMGDSGSLLLGFIAVVLSIKLMNVVGSGHVKFGAIELTSGVGFVLAVLIIPVFDTIRVFSLRILRGRSPFVADSNHLHHRLLFLGLSHMQSTLILAVVNIMFIVMAVTLQNLGNTGLVGLIFLTVLTANGLLSLYIERFKKAILNRANAAPVILEGFNDKMLDKIIEN